MIALKNGQTINPIGLCAPLADSRTNSCSETPNFHQNLEMIDLEKLEKLKGMKSMGISTPLEESKTNNISKYQTVTKTLRWFTSIQSTN